MNEKKTLTVDELREGLSEELGARVRELRRRKGLRQTGLAELIGCSNEQISNIEKGKHAPGVWTINASECILEVVEDLINRQKAEIERLKDMVAQNEGVLPKYEQLIKAEAIKEFAERIEPKLAHNTDISAVGYQSVIADIQSVVKEMTEDEDDNV